MTEKQEPERLHLRCSALPLAMRCPASVRRGKIIINESSQAADTGTAAHVALRTLPENGSIAWDNVSEIAKSFDVDETEVRVLVALGCRLWNQLSDTFPGARTEAALEREIAPGVVLSGHADILSVGEHVVRVGDWKTGRKDSDYSEQLRGYAVLALLDSDTAQEATGSILWVRDGEGENYTMDRAGAERWLRHLVKHVVDWDGVYHPGPHCSFCPRNHECEALNAMVRRDVAAITDKSLVARAECEIDLMSPDEKLDLFRKAELVVRFAQRVRDAIRKDVEERGPIVSNGAKLALEEQRKRAISTLTAWPVLEELGFTDEDFSKVVQIGITRLEKHVSQKAGPGGGAGAIRDLREALENAGAIETTTTKQLKEKRS